MSMPNESINDNKYKDESFVRRLMESYSMARMSEYEEKVFDDALIKVAEKVNPNDSMIQEYVGMKKSTIEILEQGGTWKRTRNDFVNRSDFQVDYENHQIEFKTNEIKKVNDVYGMGLTPTLEEKDYFEKNAKALALLDKIEIVLDGFYREYKNEVDSIILKTYLSSSEVTDMFGVDEIANNSNLPYLPPITRKNEKQIIKDTTYVKGFFDRYGFDLISRVIKILRGLEKEEDVESYAKKFAKEVAPLATIARDNEFDSITSTYADIPLIISGLAGLYSIIGKKFDSIVRSELRSFGSESFEWIEEKGFGIF